MLSDIIGIAVVLFLVLGSAILLLVCAAVSDPLGAMWRAEERSREQQWRKWWG